MSFLQGLRGRSSLALIALIVCTQSAHAGDGPVRNRRNTPRSASTVASSLNQSANGQYLTLSVSSLDKEFLIHASLIPQTGAATSEGTLSRVVFFRRRGNKVFLMESPQGQVVTADLPSQLILAEIPVIEATDSELVLDFNAGMKTVFTASNWYGSDVSGTTFNATNRAEGTEVAHSFIESIQTKNGTTEIRQLVQINVGHQLFPTYEVRYYISPYSPNPNFQARENGNFRQVGYFETAPILEPTTGRETSHISRWNITGLKKPITYYISANTPAEYVEAVKEGILYWNKAFGSEVLKAAVAPAGVTAPTSKENIVQWVPWDNAGFAYADGLSDPRTGEILHAQVYLTSVFAIHTKEQVRQLLRSLQHEEEADLTDDDTSTDDGDTGASDESHAPRNLAQRRHHHGHHHAAPGLKFLGSNRLCNMDLRANMVRSLEKLLDSDLEDAAILRLSQDMIRSVVAHEVGHTLGLRHNFAGKLSAKWNLEQRDAAFQAYLRQGQVPGADVEITSSVMDYLTTFDSLLSGAQMQNTERAFAYDDLAIRVGYSAGEQPVIDRRTAPLFCTDSGLGTFSDCDVFTSGSKPLASNAWEITNAVEQLPHYVINRFIAAKAAIDRRDRQPLDEVVLRPDVYASRISNSVARQLQWLNSGTRSAFIERRYPQIGPMNFLEVQTQTFKWVEHQVKELGGVENVFFSLLPLEPLELENAPEPMHPGMHPGLHYGMVPHPQPVGVRLPPLPLIEHAVAALDQQLEILKTNGFRGADGTQYHFTDAELNMIKSQGAHFFTHVEKHLLSQIIDIFLESKLDLEHKLHKTIVPEGITGQIETNLGEVAAAVIFEANDHLMEGTLHMGPRFNPTLRVPVFAHPFKVRLKAAQLLKSDLGAGPDWSLQSRRALASRMIDVIQNYLGRDIMNIKIHELERPLSQWFMEQEAILVALLDEPGCEDLLSDASEKDKSESKSKVDTRRPRQPLLVRRR